MTTPLLLSLEDVVALCDDVIDVLPLEAASLFALYSIRFCSKFGSLRYSSRAPTRDTGA